MQNDSSPSSLEILGSAKVLVSRLIAKNSERESWSICKILVEHISGFPWMRILADPGHLFTSPQFDQWQAACDRLVSGEPIQYLTGKAWFHDREFKVGPGVLIPRPETEELVEWVIGEAGQEPLRILDIGTGSGCIAVSLAASLPLAEVTGLDISEAALGYARQNADLHAPQVKLVRQDIMAAQASGPGRYEVIVSNPPYILDSEKEEMAEGVTAHEPGLALFVPDASPLLYYIKVSALASQWLVPSGKLYFEIHEDQGDAVVALLEGEGYESVELRKDLSGKNRMVRATRPSTAN